MNKHIGATVPLTNEALSLAAVRPFHSPLRHDYKRSSTQTFLLINLADAAWFVAASLPRQFHTKPGDIKSPLQGREHRDRKAATPTRDESGLAWQQTRPLRLRNLGLELEPQPEQDFAWSVVLAGDRSERAGCRHVQAEVRACAIKAGRSA
jgi:hypothetical protein